MDSTRPAAPRAVAVVGELLDRHGPSRTAYLAAAGSWGLAAAALLWAANGGPVLLGLWTALLAGWAAPALIAWWTAHPRPALAAVAAALAPAVAVVVLLPVIVAAGNDRLYLSAVVIGLAVPAVLAVRDIRTGRAVAAKSLAAVGVLLVLLHTPVPAPASALLLLVLGWAHALATLPDTRRRP